MNKLQYWIELNRVKLFYKTDTATPKNDAHIESGQKWLENNHFESLV